MADTPWNLQGIDRCSRAPLENDKVRRRYSGQDAAHRARPRPCHWLVPTYLRREMATFSVNLKHGWSSSDTKAQPLDDCLEIERALRIIGAVVNDQSPKNRISRTSYPSWHVIAYNSFPFRRVSVRQHAITVQLSTFSQFDIMSTFQTLRPKTSPFMTPRHQLWAQGQQFFHLLFLNYWSWLSAVACALLAHPVLSLAYLCRPLFEVYLGIGLASF